MTYIFEMPDLQLAQFLGIGGEAGCRSARFSMAGPCNKVGLDITGLRSSRSRGSIRTPVTSRTVGYGISPPTLAAMGMRRGPTAGRHEPLTTAFGTFLTIRFGRVPRSEPERPVRVGPFLTQIGHQPGSAVS